MALSVKGYRVQPQAGDWFSKLWTAIILLSSLYSTFFSGVWFIGAAISYRFGTLNQPGCWPAEDMSTMIALLAKAIEVSFVLVCVACIGQELSRRLVKKDSRGITISEMQLKFFLMQPGSIVTNFPAFMAVSTSYLGVLTVVAAFCAMFYTTASDALVSPKASMMQATPRSIPATVRTGFINQTHIQRGCPVQVTAAADPSALKTCDQIHQTGFAFHNLIEYLNTFTVANTSSDLLAPQNRPLPLASSDNVSSISGVWLSGDGVPEVVQNSSRLINNVTMLLPHAGVVPAAQAGGLGLAPPDANGAGELHISASVLSPSLNVLCADMGSDATTLRRIVIPEWSAAFNRSLGNVSGTVNAAADNVAASWYNGTRFGGLWNFSGTNRPPAFPSAPGPNNTRISWSQQTSGAVYLLGQDPAKHVFMCSLTAQLAHGCSTEYRWTASGGSLSADCSAGNAQAFQSPTPPARRQAGFVAAANDWSLALGLGVAAADQDGSLDRLLTQLWPASGAWAPTKPSLAEALAVLAASVLVGGSRGAPLADDAVDASGRPPAYAGSWPLHSTFAATVAESQYAMGGSGPAPRALLAVLLGVFALNAACAAYLVARLLRCRGLLQDLLDPQSLFALALNARPDDRLASARIERVARDQLRERWLVAAAAAADAPTKALSWAVLRSKWIVMGGKMTMYIHPLAEPKPAGPKAWWGWRRRGRGEVDAESASATS